jgi:hypothetical protein
MSMTPEEAKSFFEMAQTRPDALDYAKNVPGFWEAWQVSDVDAAVIALRRALANLARPELLNAQPELAAYLTEQLDLALEGW